VVKTSPEVGGPDDVRRGDCRVRADGEAFLKRVRFGFRRFARVMFAAVKTDTDGWFARVLVVTRSAG